MDHTILRMLLALAGPLLVLSDGSLTPINKTWSEKLKKDLMTDYDNTVRPAEEGDPTPVNFDITFLKIDLCDVSSTLTVTGWAKLFWVDKKMKWEPSNYGGVSELRVPHTELWKPDIFLYNSADNDIHQHGASNIVSYNNGTTLWVPPTQYKARCKLNLRLWPFDRQTCTIVVGSWTHHVGQIDLQLLQGKDDDHQNLMTENDEWILVKIAKDRHAKKYDCCVEEYADITYTIVLQRRPETYKTLVMTPAFVVIIMTLAAFLLPTNSGEKIVLNSATAIIICLFLYAASDKLPAIAFTPPLIVLYFGSCLLMVAIAFVESVVVIKMSKGCGAHPLPPFIKTALSGWLGNVILNGRQNVPKKDEEGQGSRACSNESGEFHREWNMFACALDRLFFIIYALIFLIKIISFYLSL